MDLSETFFFFWGFHLEMNYGFLVLLQILLNKKHISSEL